MIKIKNIKWNSFFGRIIFMILFGIGMIAITVSVVVLSMSRNAFTETYGVSQQKVFMQIEKEINDLHDKLQDVITAIDASWAFRLFLSGEEELDNVQTFQNIYQMETDLERSKTSDMERMNILVIGMNGKHYLSRTETISIDDKQILDSDIVKLAIEEPDILHYTFSHGSYTATTKDIDVIIVSKALFYQNSKEIYAVVLVTLTMEDMKKYYDYFITENTSFYMVDKNDIVMCSNDNSKTGTQIKDEWYGKSLQGIDTDNHLTVMKSELDYLGCSIYGVIDNDLALENLYNMPLLIVICAAIGTVILICCLVYAGRTMKPLSALVDKMKNLRGGDFKEYMPLEGTIEVQEIASTYNSMLDDLQTYIDRLMETQKEQRKAEIKALQMQINPHYIYNTLASIKWLVYQNDIQKTVQTIDAFISLLRNTISNTNEFITIEQEIVNLQNYILINHTRYGDAVQVENYVSAGCHDCLIPKLVLQPFVENAFFHAFPSGTGGMIHIFIKEKEGDLCIQIADNGVGMKQSDANQFVQHESNKEHYSGIGVHNVHERLKLLYGEGYGINIKSEEGKGTTVTILLPIKRGIEGLK